MISRLKGSVVHIDGKYVVLDVNGVGYKVFVTPDIFSKVKLNEPATIWTYMAVRENAMDLYGFPSLTELNFFELLLTVSGIGPKTAINILSVATVHSLETAIQTGETSHLTKISGIGKKVAEKIVLELKDKLGALTHSPEHTETMKTEADALEALKSLGYSQNESRDVLKKIPKTITSTSDKIKEALKILGK